MKLKEIDEKLDVFFSGEPARTGNFSSTFLFYMFLPAIAGGAIVYFSTKGIGRLIKKHKDKKAEKIGISEIVDQENTISTDSNMNEAKEPVATAPISKRSNKLTLKM